MHGVDPELGSLGLSEIDKIVISDELWDSVATTDFSSLVDNFVLPRVPRPSVCDPVFQSLVSWLLDNESVSLMEPVFELPANCWMFVIPKSNEKVSLIFHLVDLNDTQPQPARFTLAGWKKVAELFVG